MKKTFLLSLITYPLFLSAQIDTTYTGTKKETYDDGKLKSETPYVKGKMNGILKYYYESGKLMRETPYKNNRIDGVERIYFENGNLQDETTYVNGNVVGDAKTYFENGNLRVIEPFKDGRRNGIMKCYEDDGTLSCEYSYVNGKRNGISKFYYGNGKLYSECNNVNDSIISEKDYDANGNEIKVPSFIKTSNDWTIENISDGSKLFDADTLKLVTSLLSAGIAGNLTIQFSISYHYFTFYAPHNVDSASYLDATRYKVISKPYKQGTWKYNQQSNLLELKIQNGTLNYFIQTVDSQNVLLIKKK